MTKRMLIDASHTEETRVVVLDGNRLEEFDLEAANRKPLKGNIYLAKVVRVEPSLQAAFVEYGGNRHGFLAFGEIHPDYYQLPVADRQRLIEMQAEDARAAFEADERDEAEAPGAEARASDAPQQPAIEGEATATSLDATPVESTALEATPVARAEEAASEAAVQSTIDEAVAEEGLPETVPAPQPIAFSADEAEEDEEQDENPPEILGGEGPEGEDSQRERRIPPRFLRHYKIQEVIRRRQIMLVQVVKEERGTKGAALTTYISLAGRYSVLMPNSPRGGGVSRKITSAGDRKRLREAIDELEMPDGMSIIVRTAGAQRPKPEIKRDCEYLLRLWDSIRERTLASAAPALIYEEADLIKRAIRDVYARDVDEIAVEGEEAWKQARDFIRMLMPGHTRKVQLCDDGAPLFARYGVEQQLDAMHNPNVQLRSGGYLVINQAEALVAIDVNSGRNTRDRHIEDTALRTNLEAADEIARQLRLRDLAGLIVIDFIDMESSKHDAMVERRLKEALKNDRARIQVGRISHFGLLEMSRQRLRPSLAETSFITCPHCEGRGQVRSVESSALAVLRQIEEEGARRRAAEIVVHCDATVGLYLLNHKRDRLAMVEKRTGMSVIFEPDAKMLAANIRIERMKAALPDQGESQPAALRMDYSEPAETIEDEAVDTAPVVAEGEATAAAKTPDAAAQPGEAGEERGEGRRRRRRRRRGGRREEGSSEGSEGDETSADEGADEGAEGGADEGADSAAGEALPWAAQGAGPAAVPSSDEAGLEAALQAAETSEDDDAPDTEAEASAPRGEGEDDSRRRRRRGRRGGRRRQGEGGTEEHAPAAAAHPVAAPPAERRYQGPTPADPFAGHIDIFEVMEAAEAAREAPPVAASPAASPVAAPAVIPVQIEQAPPPAAPAAAPAAAPVVVPAVAQVEAAEEEAAKAAPREEAPSAPAPVAEAVAPVEAPIAAPPTAVAEPATSEPEIGPAIQPVLVEAASAAPKRRGWWSR